MKALAKLQQRWTALAQRERRMLLIGVTALGLMLLYVGAWEPLQHAITQRQEDITEARRLANQLETLALDSQSQRAKQPAASSRRSLLSVVDQSGKSSALGKAPTRLQPEGETAVKIWFEDVPFDPLLRWLHDLEMQHGIRLGDADIEKQSGSGLVNARLTLVRK